MNIEHAILSSLIHNEEYVRKVLPFIKPEYFQDKAQQKIFEIIHSYFHQYGKPPTKEALLIETNELKTLSPQIHKECNQNIDLIAKNADHRLEWLVDKSEAFCKDRAIFNALMEGVAIYGDNSGKTTRGSIPKLLSDAISVSFDTSVGHDYFEDSDIRFAAYHEKAQKVPFDLELFNKITKGGVSKKSITCLLAGVHVGKTLFLCHFAAANIRLGHNVLYITMEMGEIGDPSISERIDANILNIAINDLLILPKESFDKKLDRIKATTHGKLIVKEYPAATASASNFRALLDELKIKKQFKPDIIYIDYLNICCSSRVKMGNSVNSYFLIKSIAEELRGIAQEYDLPILTATQLNRGGMTSSDIEMTDTAESMGLPQTMDAMFALYQGEELKAMNQVMVKQLKNRFGDINYFNKFVVGIDKPRMKLYDTEQNSQKENEPEDKAIMDSTEFGIQDTERNKPKSKFGPKMFADFK